MNKFTNEKIINECKAYKKYLIISLVFFVITGILLFLGIKQSEKIEESILDLETLIQNRDTKQQNTYIEINPKTYQFAVYDGLPESYYIVSNGQYYYVAYMKDTYSIEVNNKKENVKLTGVSKIPSTDIKKLAIEVYNEGLEEDKQITIADYNNYFGDVYIDTTDKIDNGSAYYFFAFVTFIIFLIFLIISIVKKISFSKSLKKIPDEILFKLDAEMNDKDAFYYQRAKLFLTKNYIINFGGKFSYTNYKDIYWLYPYELRYNGAKTSVAIKFMDKDCNERVVANMDAYTKKSKEVYDEAWETIVNKNKNMLIGYTKENISKAKEYKKEYKNKKKNKTL